MVPSLWNFFSGLGGGHWPLMLLFTVMSFYLGTTVMALFLALAGRRPLSGLWKSILLYPLFTVSWVPLQVISVFHRTKKWKPIAHGRTRRLPAAIQ